MEMAGTADSSLQVIIRTHQSPLLEKRGFQKSKEWQNLQWKQGKTSGLRVILVKSGDRKSWWKCRSGSQVQKEAWVPSCMQCLSLSYIDLRSFLLCLSCSDCGSDWLKLCEGLSVQTSFRLNQSFYRYFNTLRAKEWKTWWKTWKFSVFIST